MPWIRDRYRELQQMIRRDAPERDVAEEIDGHIAMRVEANIAAGMSPADARAEALTRFGNVREVREEAQRIEISSTHARRRSERWRDLYGECRHGVRALVRAPVFSMTALLTLALGLGATVAAFTILDSVVLRQLSFEEADRLVWLDHPSPGFKSRPRLGLSTASFDYFHRNNKSLEAMGTYFFFEPSNVAVNGRAERAMGVNATSELFNALRVRPLIGRLFTAEEDAPNATPVIILSYDFWSEKLQSDRSLVGKTIDIEGVPLRVIGVLQPQVRLPDVVPDFWVPIQVDMKRPVNQHRYNTIARMKPGLSLEQARQDILRLGAQLQDAYPSLYTKTMISRLGFATDVRPLRDVVLRDTARPIWLVFGLVVLVLFIACANVANLFIVRANARRREAAVRIALGASRARLTLHFMVESVSLSLLAGVLALGIGAFVIHGLLIIVPAETPRVEEIVLRPIAGVVVLAASLSIGIVLGLMQTLQASSALTVLREGGRGSTLSKRENKTRSSLVVGQVALALVMLAAAGVMIRSVLQLRNVEPGFNPHNVLAIDLTLSRAQLERGVEAAHTLFRDVVRSTEALPGVARAALTSDVPMDTHAYCNALMYEEGPVITGPDDAEKIPCVPTPLITPGYFEVLGIPVRGHVPTWSEYEAQQGGVVITRSLAEKLWPGKDPIGKGMRGQFNGPPWYQIVGVIDAPHLEGLDRKATDATFFPAREKKDVPNWGVSATMTLLVRSKIGDPISLLPSIRRVVSTIDPNVAVSNPRTMEQLVSRSVSFVNFVMLILTGMAAMALLLSALGLFGVVAYLVTQRRPEIGIRMALGASDRRIVRMITSNATTLAVIGVVIGVIIAIPVVRTMRALVFGISPTDPATLIVVSLALVAIATLAGYIPARRAARIDPAEALR
jgi:putative ABC transport system permease protein